ncbi:hypothetical protein [Mucilaginibacter sp.]
MKKILLIAAVISGMGLLASCSKQTDLKISTAFYASPASAKKDIGSAD